MEMSTGGEDGDNNENTFKRQSKDSEGKLFPQSFFILFSFKWQKRRFFSVSFAIDACNKNDNDVIVK